LNGVKRVLILRSMREIGLQPMSELNALLGSEVIQADAEEDEEEGDIPRVEYDYLLAMPMWNVSHEKIEELIRQMREKKREREILEAKHINEIWNEELDHFLKVLDAYEEKEEKERLSCG